MKQRGLIKISQQLDAGNHVPQSYTLPPATEGSGETFQSPINEKKTMNLEEENPTPQETSLDVDRIDKVINFLDKALKTFNTEDAIPSVKRKKSYLTRQLIKDLHQAKQTAMSIQTHLNRKR